MATAQPPVAVEQPQTCSALSVSPSVSAALRCPVSAGRRWGGLPRKLQLPPWLLPRLVAGYGKRSPCDPAPGAPVPARAAVAGPGWPRGVARRRRSARSAGAPSAGVLPGNRGARLSPGLLVLRLPVCVLAALGKPPLLLLPTRVCDFSRLQSF